MATKDSMGTNGKRACSKKSQFNKTNIFEPARMRCWEVKFPATQLSRKSFEQLELLSLGKQT